MASTIVTTIVEQLKYGGFHNLGRFHYIQMDENTLKVSKVTTSIRNMKGVIIKYDYGSDTYTVQKYNSQGVVDYRKEVYADELAICAAEALDQELLFIK